MSQAIPRRNGMTVPLPGHLHSHREKLSELVDLGYSDIWSAESDGADAFTPLAMAAAWEPRLRLGTAIVPAFTRSPAAFAQCVASPRPGRCLQGPDAYPALRKLHCRPTGRGRSPACARSARNHALAIGHGFERRLAMGMGCPQAKRRLPARRFVQWPSVVGRPQASAGRWRN